MLSRHPKPNDCLLAAAKAVAMMALAAASLAGAACSSKSAPAGGGMCGAGAADAADSDAPPGSPVEAFCRELQTVTCQRAFACIPPDKRDATFAANLGTTLDACLASVNACCATASVKCPSYDPGYGASCLMLFNQAACADLLFGDGLIPPGDCLSACPS